MNVCERDTMRDGMREQQDASDVAKYCIEIFNIFFLHEHTRHQGRIKPTERF